MFSAERLALARRRRGFTKKQLASSAGITTRALTAYEAAEYFPTDETTTRLAHALSFPLAFLSGEPLEEIDESGVSFRSMKRMTASQKHAALAAGSFALEISRWVDSRFNLPRSDLPNLRSEKPATAARIVRHEWGLGTYSIKNMIHLLESKGVRVFSLYENAREVDAFSMWKDEIPFVFSNRIKTSAHRRFDAAHELGHLVLHKHGAPNGPLAEREADEFAAEFLMPGETVKAVTTGVETVKDLIKLKKKWMVSVAALARRLHDIGVASDWHYRMLCIRISERGYRTSEPEDYPPERSLVWEKILTSLRSSGGGPGQIASDLSIPAEEVEKLIWGLVTIGLTPPAGISFASNKTASLRIVK